MSNDNPLAPDPLEIEPQGPPPNEPKRGRGRPPKSSTAGGSSTGAGPGRPGVHATRARKVADQYEQLGAGLELAALFSPRLAMFGIAMEKHSSDLGEAWATWADTSPRVATLVDKGAFGGGMLIVIAAHVKLFRDAAGPIDPEVAAMALDLGGLMDGLDLGSMFGGMFGGGAPIDTDAVPVS
jgi:hypothetical protein